MSLVAGVKAIKKGFKGVKLNLETGDFFCDPIGKKFVFKIGKVYKIKELPSTCFRGFHFCTTLKRVLNYYPIKPNIFYTEIDTCGSILDIGSYKVAAQHIKIVRSIPLLEITKELGIKVFEFETEKVRMFTTKREYKDIKILFNTVELALIFYKGDIKRKTVTVTKILTKNRKIFYIVS